MKRNIILLMVLWCSAAALTAQESLVTTPPPTLTQWLAGKESPLDPWYQKYVSANGLPVVSSAAVSDTALLQARFIANHMLSRIPEAREEMIHCHFRIGVVGYKENITDLPECKMMSVWWPDTDWDQRGRGYGATLSIPVMSIGEENLVKIPNFQERYWSESIMVHEFAHNVDFAMRRVDAAFRDSVLRAFDMAKAEGLWKGTYSMTNSEEYFAEGAQAWFNTCRMQVPDKSGNGRTFTLKTREQLRDYDPRLYRLCASIFPEEHLHGYHFEFNTTAIHAINIGRDTDAVTYAVNGIPLVGPQRNTMMITGTRRKVYVY